MWNGKGNDGSYDKLASRQLQTAQSSKVRANIRIEVISPVGEKDVSIIHYKLSSLKTIPQAFGASVVEGALAIFQASQADIGQGEMSPLLVKEA